MEDLVSIIMPSYNTGKFIAYSIHSVIKQTYTNWELLIVDDASNDNTDEIVCSLTDARIRYFKNEQNSGAAVSRNKALMEAKGRWIAFLDSDDLWHPEKLERQISFMNKTGYSFSYTNYSVINEQSKSLKVLVTGPNHITKAGMYNYCWPGCLTVMYDACVIGLIQIEHIRKNNDYAMWLKVIRKSDCWLLDENLASYRMRTGSISDHSYSKLIGWHYKLYHDVDGQSKAASAILTIRNLFFGAVKKLYYTRRSEVVS